MPLPSWADIRRATRSIRHPNSKLPHFRDNVHGVLKSQILGLFRAQNFCYATYKVAPGPTPRTPTFYFAQGGLANLQTGAPCGRLRTNHGSGPLIDYTTTNKVHRFYATEPAARAAKALLNSGHPPPPAFLAHNAVPTVGHCHVEFTNVGGNVSRRHQSGGQVRLGVAITDDQIKKIIERMFISGCAIKVDGVVAGGFNRVHQRCFMGPLPPVVSQDVGPYLAGL